MIRLETRGVAWLNRQQNVYSLEVLELFLGGPDTIPEIVLACVSTVRQIVLQHEPR
jgi:hypothetical protein